MADISTDPGLALWFLRFGLFFGQIMFLFIYFFALVFPFQSKVNKFRQILYSIPLLLIAFLLLTPLGVESVSIQDFGAQLEVVGPLYTFSDVVGIGYLIVGAVILLTKYKSSNVREKSQIKFVLLGLTVAAVVNIITGSILALLKVQTDFILLGSFSLFIFSLFVAYAIVKHRLFNVRLIVARSVAYILLLGTMAFIYGFALFGISDLFFDGQKASMAQQAIYIILAIVLAFTFQPLRRFFEKLTDSIFYRDRYDTQVVLNNINSILTSQIDLRIIVEASLKVLCENLRVIGGRFVVIDGESIYHETVYGRLLGDKLSYNDLQTLNKNLVIADELETGDLKKTLTTHQLAVSLRLKTQEGVVGYILLGPKQNGSIYVDQDVKLLEILGDELAIAVQNARSFEKIADFNITLQKRIEEATKRLRVQNRKLKELDEAKDEFISMASHQLRTPLTSIKGYLSMLTEGDGGKLSKKQYDFADNAYVSAQRMVFLISDMLNVSRINTGKLVIEKAPLDLDVVVKDEIKQLQRTAESRNVKLSYSPPTEKLPQLSLDEGKMRQVIMNFVDNAIYYAPDTSVEVKLEIVEHKVRFSVVDHGIGVPKEAQKHLFTKFYRAGNAQKARPDGTGLGLFMAKMVVEMQGGQILFHSEEGKGSTFGFEFPLELVQASSTAATTKAAATANQTAPLK